jgi:hypothetical protein
MAVMQCIDDCQRGNHSNNGAHTGNARSGVGHTGHAGTGMGKAQRLDPGLPSRDPALPMTIFVQSTGELQPKLQVTKLVLLLLLQVRTQTHLGYCKPHLGCFVRLCQ